MGHRRGASSLGKRKEGKKLAPLSSRTKGRDNTIIHRQQHRTHKLIKKYLLSMNKKSHKQPGTVSQKFHGSNINTRPCAALFTQLWEEKKTKTEMVPLHTRV